jgi:uroporphyrinogen-III synthase
LRDAGFDAVAAPLIARREVAGWADVLPRNPDVLLLTSAHAAALLAARAPADFRPGRVAVVGPATARGARAAGLLVHVEPHEATGVAAVAALGPIVGVTVVHVRAEDAVPATRAALDASGAHVVDAVAYRTEAAPDGAAALDAAGAVDVVTLLSPSAARAYADALTRTTRHAARGVVTLGATTTDAAAALGLTVLGTGTGASLVDALRAL